MTSPLGPVGGTPLPMPLEGAQGAQGAGSSASGPTDSRIEQATADAAKQFETLLVQQLWQTMRSTVSGAGFGGGGAGSDTYMHFMDEAVATQMTEAGGIGVRSMLENAMGHDAYSRASGDGMAGLDAARMGRAGRSSAPRAPALELGPTTGVRMPGATGRLQSAARELLTPESAQRFARMGRLTPNELASEFQTEGPAGRSAFNVNDAAGFEGEYKCNLFAFEMARRAGFQTPVQGRNRGWGYPAPDAVTADAATGRLRRDWGRVVTGESAASLGAGLENGGRGLMLTSSGTNGHAGHMAIVERVHEVRYDEAGEVEQVVFDGWEARSRGARHLTNRTWNRVGTRGGNDARGGLSRIEMIELLAPREGAAEVPISARAGVSVHD